MHLFWKNLYLFRTRDKKGGIILNSIDIESKKFLGQPKNFVSIFNALLFDGKQVLKPEYLKDENSELVMNVSSKHVDIIKRYEDGTYLDLFVIESQSYVDPSMVARVMEYESVARMRYIRQNFKKHVPKNTRLPMILTVVLYVGESKWSAAKKLSELEIIHPGFEAMFNEFQLNLIELNTNHKYNTGEKATQDFFDLLSMIYRKQILKEDLDREFNRDALYFAYVVTKNKELLSIYNKSEKGDVKVCRALDEMFEESTNKGIQMGIKQGFEQGIEQGIALKELFVYQTMLEKGFSVKAIASIFSVSEESIKKLLMKA